MEKKVLIFTCQLCGIRNEDVIQRLEYQGGSGIGVVHECRDRTACWDRWKEKVKEKGGNSHARGNNQT